MHGFTKDKSCLNSFTEFFHRIFEWYIIYLDFSKVFDKVPHQRLVKELKGYGIQENVVRCIAVAGG